MKYEQYNVYVSTIQDINSTMLVAMLVLVGVSTGGMLALHFGHSLYLQNGHDCTVK